MNGALSLKAKRIFNSGVASKLIPLLLLGFFIWLMARITVEYLPYNTDVGFLRIKQDYIDIVHWRTAFFVHVYASIFVLFAGFTQFSEHIRDFYPKVHRSLGYLYAVDVVLVTGPAGLLMGFYANGGLSSKFAFVTLACLWVFCTVMAVVKARKGDFVSHRDYMIRSFALTLSAITLRAWKFSLNHLFDLPPMDVYRAVAWLGWVPNLLIAELMIWRYKIRSRTRQSGGSFQSMG